MTCGRPSPGKPQTRIFHTLRSRRRKEAETLRWGKRPPPYVGGYSLPAFRAACEMSGLLFIATVLLSPTAFLAADPPLHSAPAQLKPAAANVPYADPADPRQKVDIYAPEGAKNLPVVFWIHGGGWQAGDKTSVQLKPQAFVDKGFVFVSTSYRLLPNVDMVTIFRDVAKSLGWVHANIAKYGGDSSRIFVSDGWPCSMCVTMCCSTI